MGTFVRVMAALLVVAVVVGIGAGVYNAGVTAGLAEAAQSVASSGDPVVAPYWYGYGGPYWHGPGFFGIFFWILGIFLVFALLRVAFGWGRGGGRGPGWGGGRREMMEEMHRDLHRRDASEGERPATS